MNRVLHDYEYVGTRINNPFPSVNELLDVIDRGVSISQRCFLEHTCLLSERRDDIKCCPREYQFFRSRWHGRWVYYFQNDAIETFFMKGGMSQ